MSELPGAGTARMHAVTPRGPGAGTGYLLFAWVATLGMARLTGAVPVLIVLGAGGVGALGAVISGWWRLERIRVESASVEPDRTVSAGGIVATDDPVVVRLRLRTTSGRRPRSVHVRVLHRGRDVASGWAADGDLVASGRFDRRGIVDELDLRLASGGVTSLVWWHRRATVAVEPVAVAPRSTGPGALVTIQPHTTGADDETTGSGTAASGGEVLGVRPWREGDADHTVHWPTSLRTGSLAVYDHRREGDSRWLVRPRLDAGDREHEAGQVRWALEEGRRRGAVVYGVDPVDGAVPLADPAAIARWSATCVPDEPEPLVSRWRRVRSTHLGGAEPDETLSPRARWLVALTSAISLVMLTGALGSSMLTVAALVGGSALTAAMTTGGTTHRSLKLAVQVVVTLFTVAGLAAVIVSVSRSDDLLSVIHGPLPQVLMLLVVLHGFECTNRRAARASLAFGAVVAAYAIGQRIDPAVPLWMLGWGASWATTLRSVGTTLLPRSAARGDRTGTSRSQRPGERPAARRFVASALSLGVAAVATVALLGVVPVPDGPARLGLPSSLETVRPADTSSGIAAADGSDTTTSGSRDETSRTGSVGGYPGFDHTLDTSMRGDLGDEIVMRVRAPEPDFWRGQTFAGFDGRSWSVVDDPGMQYPGPDVDVAPTLGDVERSALVSSEEFVQTFYVETDQPNILYAAYRPERVLVEASVSLRPDGAMRTDVTLTAGAVYTVVSDRPLVTPDALARQGVVGERITRAGRDAFAAYLQVPTSTTERTIQLADELASQSSSTYDLVRRMESWIRGNVQYDLDAPVPADGVDAVDDLLYGSRRGFCEQIATALAIMLRTQGVPTRLATGYVPGTRDRVTGVWEVRASDAHAWVEVWFPETGWTSFDPTADVPLAGDSSRPSVGEDVVRAVTDAARRHGREAALVGATVLALVGIALFARHRVALRQHRRARGRWGLLQDRWARVARARGLDDSCTNPELARRWSSTDPTTAPAVSRLADRLDRAAFDPAFDVIGDDEAFADAVRLLDELERTSRAG